jgi:hypothetical protein
MAYEHESGLPNAFDRAKDKPEWQSVVFYGDRPYIQMAELTEMQTIARGRHDRLSRLVARDGDRISGADAIVDVDAKTVTLADGQVFISGDTFPVAATVLTDVAMSGRVEIGVRLVRIWITHDDDASLVGIVPGALSEGEGGAARELASIAWAISTDEGEGDFYPVYLLQDGTILDQKEPPLLEGVTQALAVYDRAHGHYIVNGCRVTALGSDAGYQHFSIEQGEANISGFKRTRAASLRHAEPEDWDEAAVPGESHTYPGGASATFILDFFPLAEVNGILLEKERTVTLTRGAQANGIDGLPDTSVLQILEVKQGATVYTTYLKTGNGVDWGPAGAEPATGSSYDVKYRYRASVVADSTTYNSITVSGGATGGEAILAYTYKLPRVDLLCLDVSGAPAYVKGVPARANPMVPVAPVEVLPLCEIHNDWINKPTIINNGISVIPYGELWKLWNVVLDHTRLIQLERLKSGIDSREPVAKKGVFVDPLVDDSYRDLGEAQSAAIGFGMMQLAIDVTIFQSTLVEPVMLDYSEQIIVSQNLKTGCTKINPYANFAPLPGVVKLTPSVDFWTVSQTVWTSPQTNEFNRGIRFDGGPLESTSSANQVVDRRQEQAEFLRPINVTFTISGFGIGEILNELTFDSLNVKPAGVQVGDAEGKITGTFAIPANVPAGTKAIVAVGAGGTRATTFFTGQGIIDIDVMRKVTTIEHWSSPPPPPPAPVPDPTQPPPIVVRPRRGSGDSSGSAGNAGADPQAQNFALTEPRQILGVNFHVCKIGNDQNHLLVNQVYTDMGFPTTDIMAEALVPMAGTAVGWRQSRYHFPVFTSDDQTFAFVIKSDDNEHSISYAKLGAFDPDLQKFVTVHPYPVGPRSSSVNAESWTLHQDESLAFELVAAWFPVTTKTVELGSFNLVNCSDLQVRAAIDLPSPECRVVFEIVRTNGEIFRLLPYQVLQLQEYITETVELRAILTGTQKLSPVLYAGPQLLSGSIRTAGEYVSRAFNFGNAVRLTSYFKAMLPAGSTVTLEYDKADDVWIAVPLIANEALSDPAWVEKKYEKTPITAAQGRLRVKITGGPASRPAFGDFGAAIM